MNKKIEELMEWVGLTDEEIWSELGMLPEDRHLRVCRTEFESFKSGTQAQLNKVLKELDYHELPKDKPPLLDEWEIMKIAVFKSSADPLEYVIKQTAQIQWDIWNKAIYGRGE